MTVRFRVALLCSLLMHLALLAGSAWHLPRFDPPPSLPPRLDAVLRPPTTLRAQRAASTASSPQAGGEAGAFRPTARLPESAAAHHVGGETAADDLPAGPDDAPAPDSVADTAALPAEPAPAAATRPSDDEIAAGQASPLAEATEAPRALRLVFVVSRGEDGFAVARAEHRLYIGDGAYRIRTELATTGLTDLVRPTQVVQHSTGHLGDGVLVPLTFRSERRGQSEETRFDWSNHRLHLADGQTLLLPAGTQDLLSLFYQLALTSASAIELPVTTGRKLERYRFENTGEVVLDTPFGPRRALHWRSRNARETTEVWLGIEERLPLKIRHIDRRGDVYDQNIERIIAEESVP